jgi:hypothetical protein
MRGEGLVARMEASCVRAVAGGLTPILRVAIEIYQHLSFSLPLVAFGFFRREP